MLLIKKSVEEKKKKRVYSVSLICQNVKKKAACQHLHFSGTGCSLKIVFFPIHCNQPPACRRASDLRSECTLLLAGHLLYNQY